MGKGEGEREGRVVESGFEEMETNITLDGLEIFICLLSEV